MSKEAKERILDDIKYAAVIGGGLSIPLIIIGLVSFGFTWYYFWIFARIALPIYAVLQISIPIMIEWEDAPEH